jgi:DNA-binding GntR family transcriptional regulator
VSTPSKTQLTHGYLRERIADGRFGPGYRLVLTALAKEIGVSVVPVREAVRMLEAEGLVDHQPNVGATVAMADEAEYVTTMQTLAIVEGAATGLASAGLTAADLDRAQDISQQMARSLGQFDPHAFTALNKQFHAVLIGSCPNSQLLGLVHRGWARLDVLRDSTFGFVPGRAQRSVDEHHHLVALIRGGAPALEVELATRAHRTATLDAFRRSRHDRS